VVFLLPAERRDEVTRALAKVPGRVLDAAPVAHGMTVECDRDAQPSSASPRARPHTRRDAGTLEQLYVYGGHGAYKPYILAEGIVTHAEGRSGVHVSAVRSYVAPIATADGRVLWHQAAPIDAEKLDIRAVPDPARRIDLAVTPEALVRNVAQSEEGFKQFLEENERLQIFYNPGFAIYSEAGESREAFLGRCREEANRRVGDEQERLESTFRRRLDQLRERSEREQREIDAKSQEEGSQHDQSQEVNVAWGQTLYNITSGRPAAVMDEKVSMRETDYLEHIALVQRAWEKELHAVRDEMNARAQEIEEISIVPTQKNIEVTKYLILWAASLP
jgi:hypothetical protein